MLAAQGRVFRQPLLRLLLRKRDPLLPHVFLKQSQRNRRQTRSAILSRPAQRGAVRRQVNLDGPERYHQRRAVSRPVGDVVGNGGLLGHGRLLECGLRRRGALLRAPDECITRLGRFAVCQTTPRVCLLRRRGRSRGGESRCDYLDQPPVLLCIASFKLTRKNYCGK
jgi:hypothetical protein